MKYYIVFLSLIILVIANDPLKASFDKKKHVDISNYLSPFTSELKGDYETNENTQIEYSFQSSEKMTVLIVFSSSFSTSNNFSSIPASVDISQRNVMNPRLEKSKIDCPDEVRDQDRNGNRDNKCRFWVFVGNPTGKNNQVNGRVTIHHFEGNKYGLVIFALIIASCMCMCLIGIVSYCLYDYIKDHRDR